MQFDRFIVFRYHVSPINHHKSHFMSETECAVLQFFSNKNIREKTKEKEKEAKNVNGENRISITKNV
jgi:hypothetical protein